MDKESELHNVLMLAGLGDKRTAKMMEFATRHWRDYGINVNVYNVGWEDGSTEFSSKLEEIINLVDELAKQGPVYLIGCSAGGSAAFNAFLKRPETIQKVVSICGRLRAGDYHSRSLERKSANSKAFKQSVLMFEGQEARIPEELKKRMMTVSARFGDQHVPGGTSHLEGAYNLKIPTTEHNLSIGMALTLLKKPVIDFIKLTPE